MNQMTKDKKVRTAITKSDHWFFFHFYFAHYVKYETAPFQNELFCLSQDENFGNLYVVAFRGSSKSTILNTSYSIWSILGNHQKKFVLILSRTQSQAKQHMMNLRGELESNTLLKNDLGPFREISDEWGSTTLVFSKIGARITVASSEQSIRGLRHNQNRPDLVIGDDVEDIDSVKTRDGRNKTYEWWTSEVIPIGQKNTRFVLIGNLLHEDSLLMRIKEDIATQKIDGVFREYPLIQGETILWLGKYPTKEDVEMEKRKSGNEFAWQREYMLNIVSNEEQAIHREWIQYYNEIPTNLKDWQGYPLNKETRIGIDLAISQKNTADYTAMVPGVILGERHDLRIYILPGIVNRRITFPETIELCKVLTETYYKENKVHPTLVIEDVAYQKALPQQLQNEGVYNVKTIRPGNQDKRSRLAMTAYLIKTGKILFPQKGAEELINQIVHFGVEKHDDLADAFSNLILNTLENPPVVPRIYYL